MFRQRLQTGSRKLIFFKNLFNQRTFLNLYCLMLVSPTSSEVLCFVGEARPRGGVMVRALEKAIYINSASCHPGVN